MSIIHFYFLYLYILTIYKYTIININKGVIIDLLSDLGTWFKFVFTI